jgi:hypothetical protein
MGKVYRITESQFNRLKTTIIAENNLPNGMDDNSFSAPGNEPVYTKNRVVFNPTTNTFDFQYTYEFMGQKKPLSYSLEIGLAQEIVEIAAQQLIDNFRQTGDLPQEIYDFVLDDIMSQN